MKKVLFVVFCALCTAIGTRAQLSQNPNKFLGNITTSYSVDAGGGVPQFYKLWNQITCENESKWSSVEGSRGNFNWNGADNAFNYAKNHGFTYKFHALVWGAQYPGWLENLSPAERFAAYVNWFDHAKEHYGTLPMIDVVNEAVGNHQAGNPMVKESLGGGGKTGYDWLIKAFEMAYERWPDAILIYNDYNSIRWDIDNYITLVRTLRDAGAPIDAYGNQAHELGGCSQSELQTNLKKQQDALLMPMFITEYDIGDANDGNQSWNYQQHFPVMWELPYCAGVTLWGYVYGKTWTTDGNSGLYKDGVERPAMTWLKEYMATDAAKNAAGPFPGTKKEASIYIRPAALKYAVNDPLPIKVRAKMATKTIAKIDLYANDDLIATMTEEPYVTEYTAATSGTKTLKAVVTTTDGATYERYSRVTISRGAKREPYNETLPELPGTIKAEEFDKGMDGVTYSKVSSTRTNFAQTATKDGAWMEYTVDVKEEGYYTMEMEVASASDGGRFHLAEYGMDNLTFLTSFTDVPKTGSTTDFKVIKFMVQINTKLSCVFILQTPDARHRRAGLLLVRAVLYPIKRNAFIVVLSSIGTRNCHIPNSVIRQIDRLRRGDNIDIRGPEMPKDAIRIVLRNVICLACRVVIPDRVLYAPPVFDSIILFLYLFQVHVHPDQRLIESLSRVAELFLLFGDLHLLLGDLFLLSEGLELLERGEQVLSGDLDAAVLHEFHDLALHDLRLGQGAAGQAVSCGDLHGGVDEVVPQLADLLVEETHGAGDQIAAIIPASVSFIYWATFAFKSV